MPGEDWGESISASPNASQNLSYSTTDNTSRQKELRLDCISHVYHVVFREGCYGWERQKGN